MYTRGWCEWRVSCARVYQMSVSSKDSEESVECKRNEEIIRSFCSATLPGNFHSLLQSFCSVLTQQFSMVGHSINPSAVIATTILNNKRRFSFVLTLSFSRDPISLHIHVLLSDSFLLFPLILFYSYRVVRLTTLSNLHTRRDDFF